MQDGQLYKGYWATTADCKGCALKASCAPKTGCKKIVRTAYHEQYRETHVRQNSWRGKQMKRLRQSWVEPVFGSLVQYYGMRKIGVIGKAGAHKVMLMAAICFNLKKYLKAAKWKIASSAALEARAGSTYLQGDCFYIRRSCFP